MVAEGAEDLVEVGVVRGRGLGVGAGARRGGGAEEAQCLVEVEEVQEVGVGCRPAGEVRGGGCGGAGRWCCPRRGGVGQELVEGAVAVGAGLGEFVGDGVVEGLQDGQG
ncbi:hypothetical protein GCM10020000_01660 [Streptomyces olivoverticillatus]